jgi:hypothetical protein
MIAASRDQGVHAASAWVEFGRGAAARTVGKPASRAVERTAFSTTSSAPGSLERLS